MEQVPYRPNTCARCLRCFTCKNAHGTSSCICEPAQVDNQNKEKFATKIALRGLTKDYALEAKVHWDSEFPSWFAFSDLLKPETCAEIRVVSICSNCITRYYQGEFYIFAVNSSINFCNANFYCQVAKRRKKAGKH